ncbi:MAG: hypothetical protein HY841_05425 [Bacteroidetes bacterium]|nr:hypothetical protein [Bacteroidota bacterium]
MKRTKNKIKFNYPNDVLVHFEKEIKREGSFEEFLIEKKAVETKNGMNFIGSYPIDKYKEIFLTGKYDSIRHLYDTEIPYVFWSKLYEALQIIRAGEVK